MNVRTVQAHSSWVTMQSGLGWALENVGGRILS